MNRQKLRRVAAAKRGSSVPTAFADDFTRTDGAMGNGWCGSTWAIVSGRAVNTYVPTTDLVVNGNFSLDTGWAVGVGWTIGLGVATFNDAGAANLTRPNVLTANQFYKSVYDINVASAIRGMNIYIGGSGNDVEHKTTGTFYDTFVANGTTTGLRAWNCNIAVDNFATYLLPKTILFSVRRLMSDVDISTNVTTAATGPFGGVIARLDDPANPQNFLIAYVNGVSGVKKLDKIVNGTRTNLISSGGSKSYSADAPIRLLVYGNYAQLKYDNENVGGQFEISTVGAGVYGGLFSSDPLVSFDSMVVSS